MSDNSNKTPGNGNRRRGFAYRRKIILLSSAPLAAERVWGWIRAKSGVRSGDGHWRTEEQEPKSEDGVGDVKDAGVVGVSGVLAGEAARTGEQVAERVDGIRDVHGAVVVAVGADESRHTGDYNLNLIGADGIHGIADNKLDKVITDAEVFGRIHAISE